jgi:hypothetical protein
MAFFDSGNSCYFSLSLTPVSDSKSYIFRVNPLQRALAKKLLPSFAWLSFGCMLVLVLWRPVIAPHIAGALYDDSRQQIILLIAGLSVAGCFVDWGLFIWVRFTKGSLLVDSERSGLQLTICRAPSLSFYALFICPVVTLVLGIMNIPNGLGSAMTSPFGHGLMLILLVSTLLFFMVICIRRIILISALK